MIHLVYVSSATRELSKQELVYLLEQSRNRNKRQNVTGMLLYVGGNFIQVLEGEKADVDEIYQDILSDDRNKENILILKENINERVFPEWSMGFKNISHQDKGTLEGYSEFLDRKMKPEQFTNKQSLVLELLYQFKKST